MTNLEERETCLMRPPERSAPPSTEQVIIHETRNKQHIPEMAETVSSEEESYQASICHDFTAKLVPENCSNLSFTKAERLLQRADDDWPLHSPPSKFWFPLVADHGVSMLTCLWCKHSPNCHFISFRAQLSASHFMPGTMIFFSWNYPKKVSYAVHMYFGNMQGPHIMYSI